MFIRNEDYKEMFETCLRYEELIKKTRILTEDEYQEYQDLKKFKEDCDKQEWDKGIEVSWKEHIDNLVDEIFETQDRHEIKIERLTDAVIKNGVKLLDQETQCPEENKHCSCRHIPYDQETIEDRETRRWEDHVRYHENLLDNQLVAEDTLKDRLDDLEGEIRTINKDLGDQKHTQKLINKIVQEQINGMERVRCECECCRDGEETLPKQTNKGTKRKVKVRVEKSS